MQNLTKVQIKPQTLMITQTVRRKLKGFEMWIWRRTEIITLKTMNAERYLSKAIARPIGQRKH